MVHQHFMLIPVMTVVENIVLGAEPTRHGQLDLDTARERVRELSASYGLAVDPDAVIEEIGVGQQQRVEILKALYRDARVLILDEPTAVLTPQEVDELFAVLRTLVAGGHVDHPDHAQAARGARGRRPHLGAAARQEGRDDRPRGRQRAQPGRADGRPRGAARRRARRRASRREDARACTICGCATIAGSTRCAASRWTSRAGEIVGIAGVDGNGQSELIQALAGMRDPARGQHRAATASTSRRATPREASDAGVGHIPEDRQRHGLVLDFSIAENTALHDYDEPPISRHHWLDRDAMAARAAEWIQLYDVRGGGPETPRARALGRQSAEGRARARDPVRTRAC